MLVERASSPAVVCGRDRCGADAIEEDVLVVGQVRRQRQGREPAGEPQAVVLAGRTDAVDQLLRLREGTCTWK
ncbi:hypothetical protein [Saccharopolyspora erythraea]|uniref:hypothetical protein n=1 Tax=Saccharopolyspora erythraea TaxID=1836 RepID=UPI000321768A|nr:hypothetical protein [Saccharopolyspora erythraea]